MGMEKEFIAYEGQQLTVEWYFNESGKSQALTYYSELADNERIDLLKLVKRIGDAGLIKNKTKFNYEGDKIYAFKPQPDRFLCFFHRDKKIIITNAFRKKQQKLPDHQKEKALKAKQDYEIRVNEDKYYE